MDLVSIMIQIIQGYLRVYLSNKTATTAIEYGLIAAAISLAIATIVFLFGDQVAILYTALQDMMIWAVAQRP